MYIECSNSEKENITSMLEKILPVVKNIEFELNNIKDILDDFMEKEDRMYFQVFPMREHILEANTRVRAALIRIQEFAEEVENNRVSTSGLY